MTVAVCEAKDAWGILPFDHFSEKADHVSSNRSKVYAIAINVANMAGYLLSTVIGLFRMCFAAYGLYKLYHGKGATTLSRGYLLSQLGRGAIEFFGFGLFLAPVDIILTMERYQVGYFKPASTKE